MPGSWVWPRPLVPEKPVLLGRVATGAWDDDHAADTGRSRFGCWSVCRAGSAGGEPVVLPDSVAARDALTVEGTGQRQWRCVAGLNHHGYDARLASEMIL